MRKVKLKKKKNLDCDCLSWRAWNNKNVSPAFVGLQINFTTSCATAIFFFRLLVTWGSVWAKIQGVLKEAHRRTPCHRNTHTGGNARAHTHTHWKPQTNTATELEWRSKRQIKRRTDSLFLPKCSKPCPFPHAAEGRAALYQELLWCLPKYH